MRRSLDEIYEEVYSKYGIKLEENKKIDEKISKVAMAVWAIIAAISIVILIFIGFNFSNIIKIGGVNFVCWMITSIVVACILSMGERKNGSSKKDIIKTIVYGVFPSAEYSRGKGIPSSEYRGYFFGDKCDRFFSEDLIATNDKINLNFSEVHTQYMFKNKEGDYEYRTSFLGIAGYFDLPKSIDTKIYITADKKLEKKTEDKVCLDMPEFEEIFDVYTGNKITAVALLTADVMTELIEMKKKLNLMFDIAIENDRVYFRINTGEILEVEMFIDTQLSIEILSKHYSLLCYVDDVAKLLYKHIGNLEI